MEPGEIQMMVTRLRKVPAELRVALLLSAVTFMASEEGQQLLPKDFEFPDHVPPTTAKHVVILDFMARALDAHKQGMHVIQGTTVWLGNVISKAFPHLNAVEVRKHVVDFQSFLSLVFGPNGHISARPPQRNPPIDQ